MKTPQSSAKLARVLQALFTQQAQDVLRKINLFSDETPDLSHWVDITAQTTKPILLELYRQGMLRSTASIAHQAQTRPSERAQDGMRSYTLTNESIFGPAKKSVQSVMVGRRWGASGWPIIRKSKKKPNQLDVRFDLFNPKVLDAVDEATLFFCRETNETATKELTEALDDLRKLLKAGLAAGDAYSLLARKIREIFSDPARAFRIAVTEGSRAMNNGQLLAAKESGLKLFKEWLASSDACDGCIELSMKDAIPLDQAFIILPGGGPYAKVMAPPLHPHCFCTLNEVLQ